MYKRQPDAVIPKEVLIKDGIIDPKKTAKRSRTAKRLRKEAREAKAKMLEVDLNKNEIEQASEEEEMEAAEPEIETKKLDLLASDDEAEAQGEDQEDVEMDDEMDLEGVATDSENDQESEELDLDHAEEMVGGVSSDETDEEDADLDHFEKAKKKQEKRKQKILEKLAAAEDVKDEVAENAEDDLGGEIEMDTLTDLPSKTDLENNNLLDVDILLDRINKNIVTLKDFKKYRNGKNSRTEYLNVLIADLCTYYGYNEFLMTEFLQLGFGVDFGADFFVIWGVIKAKNQLQNLTLASPPRRAHRVFRRQRETQTYGYSNQHAQSQTSRIGPKSNFSFCQFGPPRKMVQHRLRDSRFHGPHRCHP